MKLIPKNTSEDYLEEAEVQSFNAKDYLLRYFKFWPYFLLSITLALAAAFVANKFVTPQYKVESKFLIKEDNPNAGILDLTGLATGKRYSSDQMSNESITMKSKPMARGALERLDFDVEYFSTDLQIPIEVYKSAPIEVEVDWKHPQLTETIINITWDSPTSYVLDLPEDLYNRYSPETGRTVEIPKPFLRMKAFPFGEWLEVDDLRIKVSLNEKYNTPSGEYIIKIRSQNSLVSQYTGENLQIFPMDPNSTILGLSLITKNAQKGIDYLNQLMEIYLEHELLEKNKLASNTVDFIDNQIAGVSDSLGFIENRLQNYRSSHKTYNIGSEGNSMFDRISNLESELAQHKYKKEYYQNLQNYLSKEDYNEIVMPSGLGIDDPILNTLIDNLIKLQSDKSRLMVYLKEASPSVKEVNKKIKDLTSSIREVIQNAGKTTDQAIADLQSRIRKMESDFSKLPYTEQNLLRIQRQFAINESIYTFLLQRRAESAISLASNTTTNKIVEYAGPGSTPITLPYLTNYIIALIAGIVIPFSIITLAYMFNQNIRDLNEVEKKLNVPVLTQIGRNKYKSNLVVLNEPQSAITESFRSLKTNIHFISPKEKRVTIALTSSISGEGKTFCAINLASTYSLNNKKTILVGCDMRKPKIFGDFELNNDIGLSTYLSMQSNDLSSVIQTTKYKDLDILVAGPIPPNPSELLVSSHFENLIRELQAKYDVVILDTPPLGLVSETLEILQLVDLTLFMIRYDYSKISFISEINKLKRKLGQPHLYAVINDVSGKELTYGGYGYGYYKEDRKPSLFERLIGRSSRNVGL